MDIGLPKERRNSEYRVALTPAAVQQLVSRGHRVYVERGAGEGSGFMNQDYLDAGATVVYSPEEVYHRGELVVKVARPLENELELLHEGQVVMAFMHLASAHPNKMRILLEKKVTAIGLETIQEEDGYLPVLHPISKMAGRMAPHIASRLLQNDSGGKGILLGGVTGVAPAEVVIIGTGTVGTEAAVAFANAGASVYALDINARALERVEERTRQRVVTLAATQHNLRKVLRFADVLLLAVYRPGYRAPVVIRRDMLSTMRNRSVLIDFSIDQGGATETSRPTSHSSPTYVVDGVIHYCVPNITGVVGRTATHAISNAVLPFVCAIANEGFEKAVEKHPALARGVNTHQGEIVHPALKELYTMSGQNHG